MVNRMVFGVYMFMFTAAFYGLFQAVGVIQAGFLFEKSKFFFVSYRNGGSYAVSFFHRTSISLSFQFDYRVEFSTFLCTRKPQRIGRSHNTKKFFDINGKQNIRFDRNFLSIICMLLSDE